MLNKILAIDTYTTACSVALMIHSTISEFSFITKFKNLKYIILIINFVLKKANIFLEEIDVLAFGRGPGNFTSIRISLGLAQGLALGANMPLTPISTLATLAQGAWRNTGARKVLIAIDAHLGEVYWAKYCRKSDGRWLGDESEAVLKPSVIVVIISELTGKWTCVGNGWQNYPTLLTASQLTLNDDGHTALPTPLDMLSLALQQWRNCSVLSVEQVEPAYLRNEVACKKKLHRCWAVDDR